MTPHESSACLFDHFDTLFHSIGPCRRNKCSRLFQPCILQGGSCSVPAGSNRRCVSQQKLAAFHCLSYLSTNDCCTAHAALKAPAVSSKKIQFLGLARRHLYTHMDDLPARRPSWSVSQRLPRFLQCSWEIRTFSG